MKKIYLLVLVILIFVLSVLLFIYNEYSAIYEEDVINSYIDKNHEILNDVIESEKRYALSLSLLISQNPNFRKALIQINQKLALEEMKVVLKNIQKSTGINGIDIQIHTKDLRAFARSWDHGNYFGVKLSSFRKGLVIVKNSKKPFVSIELGKRLNIKAISPVLNKNKQFLGSIEVIMGFNNIKKRLKKFNLKMIVLLDKKFINIAVDLKNHKRIDKYFIAERVFDENFYKQLLKNTYIFKRKKPYYKIGDNIVVVLPMKSVGIQNVGLIVFCMSIKESSAYSLSSMDEINEKNIAYKFKSSKMRKVIIR